MVLTTLLVLFILFLPCFHIHSRVTLIIMQMKLLVIALVFAVVHAANVAVQVGNGGNNFNPKNVSANIGDTVKYALSSYTYLHLSCHFFPFIAFPICLSITISTLFYSLLNTSSTSLSTRPIHPIPRNSFFTPSYLTGGHGSEVDTT